MKNALWTVALGALLCASPAYAQQGDDDAEVTKMAKEHYKAGLDAYKSGKYDVAIKELKKAYLLKRLPALLLNIGATYRKMGDLDLALHFYQKYLEEAPAEARDRSDVEKTIAEIKSEKAGGGAKEEVAEKPTSKEEPVTAPPPPPPAKEWSHVPVDAAPPDSPLDVRVSSPVMKGVKVWVYFRGAGEESYRQVLMHRRGAEKVGRIPADAMQGKAIQYYVEARDTAGTVVKASGSAVSPNVVMIDPSAPPQLVASIGGEESKSRAAEEAQQPQGEEEQRARRNTEDEEAPMSGQVSEPRRTKKRTAGGGKEMGILTKAGIGLAAGGVGILAGGIVCGVLAMSKSNQISGDSMNPVDVNNNKIFYNNDPNAGSTQEADIASQGQLLNNLGIALDVVGGVAALGGVAMIIVDQVVLNGGHKERPKKRRAAPRPVEEEASIKNWYVTPTSSHNFAGVSGGFQF